MRVGGDREGAVGRWGAVFALGTCLFCKKGTHSARGNPVRRVHLHVAQAHGLAQHGQRIRVGMNSWPTCRVTHLEQRFHNGPVVDLLFVIQFAPAGVARGVDMAQVVLVLADASDDIAVHDLHVVDVEQQLEPG